MRAYHCIGAHAVFLPRHQRMNDNSCIQQKNGATPKMASLHIKLVHDVDRFNPAHIAHFCANGIMVDYDAFLRLDCRAKRD